MTLKMISLRSLKFTSCHVYVNSFTIMKTILIILAIIQTLNHVVSCVESQQPSLRYSRGVHTDRLSHYSLSEEQTTFTCLDNSATISRDSVNDDYCDCNDGSDEPGTSACSNGQFFCHNIGHLPRFIPSSWVNDGQCDCCDASDEYNQSGDDIRCHNNCDTLGENYRREQAKQLELYEQGSSLRSKYKELAKTKREQNNELLQQYKTEMTEKENAIRRIEEEMNSDFGPSSVFLPLKGRCFTFKDREYTYSYCPFERTTQESIGGLQTELGRWSSWSGPADNLYSRQKYDGGVQCWNGPARSSVVNIACGVEDVVTSVTEPSKCEYVFEFLTPAACPDTDPPAEEPPTNNESESNQVEGETESLVHASSHEQNLDDQIEQPLDHEPLPDESSSPTDDTPHDEL